MVHAEAREVLANVPKEQLRGEVEPTGQYRPTPQGPLPPDTVDGARFALLLPQ